MKKKGTKEERMRMRSKCNCDELKYVECVLETKDLWDKFHDLETEMIITKTGRYRIHCTTFYSQNRYRDGSGDQHEGLPGDCPGARSADGADQSQTNQQLHRGQQLRHRRQYGLRVLLLGKRI